MLQIALTLAGYLLLVFPAGWYLCRVAEGGPTPGEAVFGPVDRALYALCGIDPQRNMTWKQYALTLLLTNAVMLFTSYAVLRMQHIPLLNPNHIGGMEQSLSFNTVISFMTNTNLQHYAGESGLSYLSQTLVIIFMMFTSAATGLGACMAFMRALTGGSMGSFHADMTRSVTRVLLPLSLLAGLLLVFQGVPQTMAPTVTLTTVEGTRQDVAVGPIAALVSIKHLGTNGGGFLGANSATPQENPTVVSNLIELYSMMLLPGACVAAFGLMLLRRRSAADGAAPQRPALMGGEARTLFLAMGIIFLLGLALCYTAERAGNPALARAGLSQAMGNMEGKEVRFGIAQSTLFTTATTAFTTGSVNNMHDTLTPLGGLTPLLLMMLNVVFGGAGVGFMNIMMYMLLAVFICGLMVGRTPEYLGKKVEGREMKLVTLALVLHPLLVLGCTALALSVPQGLAAISNPGFHGLSQVLYEFTSAAANNGSGFEGLADNTLFWNISTGAAMFYGHYIPLVLQLAIAGSLMLKRPVSASAGTLRTDSLAFPLTLAMLVLIFAALTFFPALALGPVAEHLTLRQ